MLPYRPFYFLLLLFTTLAACGDKAASDRIPGNGETRSVTAAVMTAAWREVPQTFEAVGTIEARTAGTLAAKLMGTVKEVHVQEGDTVKTGDLLVTIDARQAKAGLEQARAALAETKKAGKAARAARDAARAGADFARTTHERYEKLLADHSVSRQEYDAIASNHRQAAAAFAQAEQMVAAAREGIRRATSAVAAASVPFEDATVRAPFDGVIRSQLVDAGDMAAPGLPLLAIEGCDGYELSATLPASLYGQVTIGQVIPVEIPAIGGPSVAGTVRVVSPGADPRSRQFLVKIALPATAELHSGMFARAMVPVGRTREMQIPTAAVLTRGQLTGVYVLDENDMARWRLVRVGRTADGLVEIAAGLAEGECIVAAPGPALAAGVKVEAVR